MTDSVQRAHTLPVVELTLAELCWRIGIASSSLERLAVERKSGKFYSDEAKAMNETLIVGRLRDIEAALNRLWEIL